ncbi:MAG: flagellar biosynthesis protein FlhB [Clostridia bacterium]|nr:flagellar biosynthesis protein FlhB [Clostridia bacterium]MDN5322948.1 flagellar biosynthesis protein FlhB [Clostridia bacterium]
MKKRYYLNLQLFAGEKTEKATPKRRQEARKKGQVLKSTEVNSVIILSAAFMLLKLLLPVMLQQIETFIYNLWTTTLIDNITIVSITPILISLIFLFFKLLLPFLLIIMVAGVMANLVQVGFLFTTETLQLKLSRLNPVEGFKRIFSKKAIAELLKSLGKIGLIGYIAYINIKNKVNSFPYLMDMELKAIIGFIGDILFTILWKVTLVLAFLALLDYLYQKYEYETNLKMSKQEIKDEYKNIEGDPQIKGKIKEKQRQMALNRMMQEVPKADVVITNPTHFAVALKYDAKNMDAPIVIAKGQDLVALRIKDIAQKTGVITVENKPLAQVLFHNVDINEQIPEDLFQAVAEILAFVYRLKQKA